MALMGEIPLLDPILLPQVVQEFDGNEDLMARSLVSIDHDTQPIWAYDIEQADRGKLESYQAPNTEARLLPHSGFGHMTGTYAYTRIKKMFSPTTLRTLRALGEGRASAQAGEQYVMRELQIMRDQIMRQEEYAIWEMIKGSWTYKTESGASFTVNYGVPSGNKVTTSSDANWITNGGTAGKAIADIGAMKRQVSHLTGRPIQRAYANHKTFERIMGHPDFKANLSDVQKDLYTRENYVPRFYGIDWYEYDGGYVNDSDTFTPYIPNDLIIFFTDLSVNNPLVLKYGPSLDHDSPAGWTGTFTKTWIEPDPSNRQVLMEVQYMPILLNPNKIATLDIDA